MISKLEDYIPAIIIGFGILIIASLVFYSIENPSPSAGYVVGKEYKPAYDVTRYHTIHTSDKTTARVPYTEHVSEKYIIVIEGKNKKDKMVKCSFYVTESEYHQLQIGDYYVRRAER